MNTPTPSRWILIAVLALTLLAPSDALAAIGPGERAGFAATMPDDRAATRTLLKAEYGLDEAIRVHRRTLEMAMARSAEALGHECKGVLRGAPDESVIEEEGPSASSPKLSGRVQGERARSELEKQTIEMEIDETIVAAAYGAVRRPYEVFIATADRLTWSNPTINALVHQKMTRLQEYLRGPAVPACAEMRMWAASGFHVLPPGSRGLQEARNARGKQAVRGSLAALLRPYEDRADRAIVRRMTALKERMREDERTDERLSHAVFNMQLAFGEKLSRFTEQRLAPVIGRGRTHAGTTFVVRASVSRDSRGTCRHEVDVEVHEGNGGSAGGLCLSEGAHPQPSSSCSGSVETVELATLPDVRRAKLRLNDGHAVTISVVHVPAKYGGPAGVLIDAFRGHNRYPVSAQELSASGRVLHTVRLSAVRCDRGPAGEAPGPPRFVALAKATAPSGEPLTVEGTLLRFHGQTELSLGPQPALRNSEVGEDSGSPKRQFQWSLSTECAPHPYSLLDGILASPGTSVLVRTSAGLVPLTKVELAASLHAAGPLFYGVYSTPPTEIVVERSDGSVLYTESLAAKATEETEFCEGYAER